MEKDLDLKMLVIEIRQYASKLAESGGKNPLDFLDVNLEEADITTLRQIRSRFRDLHRSLGGSRGQ